MNAISETRIVDQGEQVCFFEMEMIVHSTRVRTVSPTMTYMSALTQIVRLRHIYPKANFYLGDADRYPLTMQDIPADWF